MTEEKFLQALENNEEKLNNKELATQLGISEAYFYKLKKKLKDKISTVAKEITRSNAIRNIHNLQRNADAGDTTAATRLLEMADVYVPKKQLDAGAGLKEGIQRIFVPQKKEEGAPVDQT